MTTQTAPPSTEIEHWHELAQQLRVDSIRSSTAAASGHPTSSLSAADLMAVLMAKYLRYDYNNPKNPNNDHLIFSKGHASPLVYAMFKAAGAISDEEMMSFRKFGSKFEGHPTPRIPWIDVATGSLGQGFPIGVGVALAGKYLDKLPYRIWVLLGDGETAEGSVWEAFDKAAFFNLDRLIAIIDVNRLGQTGPTELQWNLDAYRARAAAFGWNAIEVDGHDLQQIDQAYSQAVNHQGSPTVIIAKTIKGEGAPSIANTNGWHGKAIPKDQAEKDIAALGGERNIVIEVHKPPSDQAAQLSEPQPLELPAYKQGDGVPTRKAYGDALKALGGHYPRVVVVDAEVGNSTHAEEFKDVYPERFFENYIAEQQMISAAVGLQVRGYVPFASTFAAFLTRAYDFIRMAAISQANLKMCGSHAGVSIGEDGPSQMGLEDIAMMRAVHGSTVLYPCDANQTAKLMVEMAERDGIDYIRTTRAKTPVIYSPDDSFTIGGSRVLRQSNNDVVTVIAAGITVGEALEAYDRLQTDDISIRVIDAYSVKPIDVETIRQAARDTGGRLITVEDHWCEGGLGDAVLDAFVGQSQTLPTVVKLAVHDLACSGEPDELIHWAGIDADAIVEAVRGLTQGQG